MSRKSVIVCLCVVLVLVIANALAIAFLYAPSLAHREAVSVSPDTTSVVAKPVENKAVADSVAKRPMADAAAAAPQKTAEPAVTVDVPRGPFEVKNCGTGLMNKLSQADDNSLSLTDHRGTVLWTIPFEGRLCGMVGTVDYFANGKLQFLFASGDRLWLFDRLGREVRGFPAALEKSVLLGPAVYDFNGTRKYNVMVLNKDNTIDMYNLQGRKPDGWKTIGLTETIIGLPERLKHAGKDYWIVRTQSGSHVYDFYGNPVKVFDGEVKPNEL